MKKNTTETEIITIDTTIGDLICAITDATMESSVSEQHAKSVTHAILHDLLQKRVDVEIEKSN